LQGVVFVGFADEEVDDAVDDEPLVSVPFTVDVVVSRLVPLSSVKEAVVVDELVTFEVPIVLSLLLIVPIPLSDVDSVRVVEIEGYVPVGNPSVEVIDEDPVKTITSLLD
jgi:hypothetical protein